MQKEQKPEATEADDAQEAEAWSDGSRWCARGRSLKRRKLAVQKKQKTGYRQQRMLPEAARVQHIGSEKSEEHRL